MSENGSDIKVTAADALEFERISAKKGKLGKIIRVFFLCSFSAGVGATGWEYFGYRVLDIVGIESAEYPIIKAKLGEVKRRPENPGGIKVRNRDTYVYDDIHEAAGGQQRQAPIERLLPLPEQPLEKNFKKSAVKSNKSPVLNGKNINLLEQKKPVMVAPTKEDVEKAEKPDLPPLIPSLSNIVIENKYKDKDKESFEDNQGSLVSQKRKLSLKRKTAVEKEVKTQNSNGRLMSERNKISKEAQNNAFRVQLAASRTRIAAQKVWTKIQNSNLDLLQKFKMKVTRVNLGKDKGIFYRLRIAPFSGKDEAQKLCRALRQRKVGCLVIRPSR